MFGSSTRGLAALLLFVAAAQPVASCIDRGGQASAEPTTPVVLNDNGAWCWFQDERAVVDHLDRLVVGSVADGSGTEGTARDGNVEVVAYDLVSASVERHVLHAGLGGDDHNAPALHVRADGRYVAMYTAHGEDHLVRWRVTATAGQLDWQPEQQLRLGDRVTYSNIVSAGDRLLAFTRADGWDPHVLESRDDGATWRDVGRLLAGPGRPYVRYAAGLAGVVHVFTTEQHPDAAVTSVYHGVVDGRRLRTSDGTVVDEDLGDDHAVAPEALTPVHLAAPGERAWTLDVQTDGEGRPVVVFSVRRTDRHPAVNEYRYARYDGRWRVHGLALAGSSLTPGQPHYTGGAALDPADPHRVVVSTDVDPVTGAVLVGARDGRRHHELFEGRTRDGGATWSWTPLTRDSGADNLRPVVPAWNGPDAPVLWMRGTYTGYRDYDLDIVALFAAPSGDHGAPSVDRATPTAPGRRP